MRAANFVFVIIVSSDQGNIEEESGDEDEVSTEYSTWNELRLHPLLMRSICRLGFKDPTPIQKACIPAAAHQGKVGYGSF